VPGALPPRAAVNTARHLKRGLTDSRSVDGRRPAARHAQQLRTDFRGDAEVVIMARQKTERARFVLKKCLLAKLKAPTLNAKTAPSRSKKCSSSTVAQL